MSRQAYHQFMKMRSGSSVKNDHNSLSSTPESHKSSVKSKEEDTAHKLYNYHLSHAIVHMHDQRKNEKYIQQPPLIIVRNSRRHQ